MDTRFSLRVVAVVASVGVVVGVGLSAVTSGGWGHGANVAAQSVTPISTAGAMQRIITVAGTGIATLPPDLARFTVGITEQGMDVMTPQAIVAMKTDAIIAAVRTSGVDVDRDVRTSNYSIQPVYTYSGGTQTLTGYRVMNQVNVTVRDIRGNRVGTLIDATVKAGANTVSSISFGLDNPNAAVTQAREDAVRNARAKADTLARVAGATVGPVITISETSVAPVEARTVSAVAVATGASGGAAPPTAIQAGETSVTINVSIVYALQ